MEDKQWTVTLHSQIFAIEHNRRRMSRQPGPLQQQRWGCTTPGPP
jgi:hypothetical protein